MMASSFQIYSNLFQLRLPRSVDLLLAESSLFWSLDFFFFPLFFESLSGGLLMQAISSAIG